jgi:hypothetical protein
MHPASGSDADDEEEGGEEGEEGEAGRRPPSDRQLRQRAKWSAQRTAMHARRRGEREDPYADVPVGYLIDLYSSSRFADLESGVRHALLLQAIHHHERHLLEHEGTIATDLAPYVRRRQQHGRGGAGGARFEVATAPAVDACPLQQAAAVPDPARTASRGRDGPTADGVERPPSPSAILTPAKFPASVPVDEAAADDDSTARGTSVPVAARLALALVREADAVLRCVLCQYRGLAARADRCMREARLVGDALGRYADTAYSASMADHDERHLLTTMRSMVHGRRPISPCPSRLGMMSYE